MADARAEPPPWPPPEPAAEASAASVGGGDEAAVDAVDAGEAPALTAASSAVAQSPVAAPAEDEGRRVRFEGTESWDFNVLLLSKDSLEELIEQLFDDVGVLESCGVPRAAFRRLVSAVRAAHRDNSFHNFWRAAALVHCLGTLMCAGEARVMLAEEDTLALLLAGLCHGCDHPGLTNAFLVRTKDPLAVRYPHGSALEHHAATVALRLLASGPCAPVLGAMPDSARAERVATLLPALLVACDAARLPRIVARLGSRCAPEQPPLDCRGSQADAALLSAALLHVALTCAGAGAPWAAASTWGGLRGAEWVLQGALEREARLELTSPLMDAATADVARAEAGLLAHCAVPLLRALGEGPLPWVASLPLRRCEANVLSWGARVRAGLASPPPEAPVVAGVALECVRSVTARRARLAAGLDPDAPLPPLPSAGGIGATSRGGSSAGGSPAPSRPGSFLLRMPSSSSLHGSDGGNTHGGRASSPAGGDSGRLSAAGGLRSVGSLQASSTALSGLGAAGVPPSPGAVTAALARVGSYAAASYGGASFGGYGVGYTGAGGSFHSTGGGSFRDADAGLYSVFAAAGALPPPAAVGDAALPRAPAALARVSSASSAFDLETGSTADTYDIGGRGNFSASGSGRLGGGMARIRAIATQRVRLRRMQSSTGLTMDEETSVSMGGYATAEQSVRYGGASVRGGNAAASDAMTGVELSAAAVAAAKRNAASARDVALCLGIADTTPASPSAAEADGETPGSAATAALAAGAFDEIFDADGCASDATPKALQPQAPPGWKGPLSLLQRHTFRMSDLAADDAEAGGTLDSSTAVALATFAKAGAAALFALPAVIPPLHRRAWTAICAAFDRFRARPRVAATAALVEGAQWQLIMLVLTVYVLFAEDIKMATLPPSVDPAFRGAAIFVFSVFVLELLIRCVCEDAFFGRFFFWLDLGAALSLLPDFLPQQNAADLAYGRAGRAARVGARLGRVVRFIRVVQQLRALALERMRAARLERRLAAVAAAEEAEAAALGVPVEALRAAQNASRRLQRSTAAKVVAATMSADDWAREDEPQHGDKHTEVVDEDGRSAAARLRRGKVAPTHGSTGMARASAVWERLNTAMSRKLILGLLSVIIVLPFLEVHLRDFSPDLFLTTLESWPFGSDGFNATLGTYAAFGGGGSDAARRVVVLVEACSPLGGAPGVPIAALPYDACDAPGASGVAWMPLLRRGAELEGPGARRASELLRVLSASGNSLVVFDIKPESVLEAKLNAALTVGIVGLLLGWAFYFAKDAHRLLINPIGKMVSLINLLAENPIHALEVKHTVSRGVELETDKVIFTLLKVGNLLKSSLGEAGLDIISANLRDSSKPFDPMTPGRRVQGAYAFCDVRKFTDATECLEEEVMTFVNAIAELVHGAAVATGGAPNKNVGDAFLCVWRSSAAEAAAARLRVSYADRALSAAAAVLRDVRVSDRLRSFAAHPRIRARLGDAWRVRLGFGLHCGWSIEGAIGSRHKVDPSYLSPHVNLAARLEGATKQYGVPILMSGAFAEALLLEEHTSAMRRVDRVRLRGSAVPMDLYTYDCGEAEGYCDAFVPPPLVVADSGAATLPPALRALAAGPGVGPDGGGCRGMAWDDYRALFKAGVDAYVAGHWPAACDALRRCAAAWPADAPPRVLLDFMTREHAGEAPSDWTGVRDLVEK